jgi:phosphatidylglycerophosphate synthase
MTKLIAVLFDEKSELNYSRQNPFKKIGGLSTANRLARGLAAAGVQEIFIASPEPEKWISHLREDPFLRTTDLADLKIQALNPLTLGELVFETPNPRKLARALVLDLHAVFTPKGLERVLEKARSAPPSATIAFRETTQQKELAWTGPLDRLERRWESFSELESESFDSLASYECAIVNSAINSAVDSRQALHILLESLRKPTDGPVSKALNRPLSLWVSGKVVNLGITPFWMTSFVFLLTLVGVALALHAEYWSLAVGGVIFHIASVLDGCDGELARMTYRSTDFGAWYDTLTDNVRYGLFYCATGVAVYRNGASQLYLWAIGYFLLLHACHVINSSRLVLASGSSGTFLTVTKTVKSISQNSRKNNQWERWLMPVSFLVKSDVSAFIVMILCLANLPALIFWLACIGITLMAISSARALKKFLDPEASSASDGIFFAFYVAGFVALAFVVSRIPHQELAQALGHVGWGFVLVLAVSGSWIALNASSVGVLARGRMSFRQLLYNQLVGEGYNALVPLAGMAGEPFKLRYLTTWLGRAEAGRVVVLERVLHSIAGVLFSIGGFVAILLTLHLSNVWQTTLKMGLSVFALWIVLLLWVFRSRMLARLARKVGLQEGLTLPTGVVLRALALKFIGRVLSLVEVAVILYLLRIDPTLDRILLTGILVTASGLIAFAVPQGLGVNEFSVMGAFKLLGLSTPLAIAFGLVRRARILCWALVGVLLHFAASALPWLAQYTARPSEELEPETLELVSRGGRL